MLDHGFYTKKGVFLKLRNRVIAVRAFCLHYTSDRTDRSDPSDPSYSSPGPVTRPSLSFAPFDSLQFMHDY